MLDFGSKTGRDWLNAILLSAAATASCTTSKPRAEGSNPTTDPIISTTLSEELGTITRPQTLSALRERFGEIVRADQSSAPILRVGAEKFFERKGEIKITLTNTRTGELAREVWVDSENFPEHRELVMSFCLQERLKSNQPLNQLYFKGKSDPESCDRIDSCILAGIRARPDSIVEAWKIASDDFGKNNRPPGSISDFRAVMTKINSADTDERKERIIENIERSILAGNDLELKSTAPGSNETLTITAENLEKHRIELNSILFNLRVEINPELQELLAREEIGDLAIFEKAALEGHRRFPSNRAEAYRHGEKAFNQALLQISQDPVKN